MPAKPSTRVVDSSFWRPCRADDRCNHNVIAESLELPGDRGYAEVGTAQIREPRSMELPRIVPLFGASMFVALGAELAWPTALLALRHRLEAKSRPTVGANPKEGRGGCPHVGIKGHRFHPSIGGKDKPLRP